MNEPVDLTLSDPPEQEPDMSVSHLFASSVLCFQTTNRTYLATDPHPLSSPFIRQSELLEGLNDAQKEAVTASPKGGVFAAGVPGCGKTKTLTSRVAYLVTHYGLEPSRLV